MNFDLSFVKIIVTLIWNVEFHALFEKKLIFRQGGTCSAILGKKAKVELIPPLLLEVIVELVPSTLEKCTFGQELVFPMQKLQNGRILM